MKTKWIFWMVIIFAVGIVFYPRKPTTIPYDLVGVWETSYEKYSDRSLQITPVTVVIGVGKGKVNVYFISKIEEAKNKDFIYYTLYFHDMKGMEQKLKLYYQQKAGGIIRLKNQVRIAWKRKRK